jgi:urease accessory protein
VSGLDHVLAMIAVGLWGAQLGVPALWLLPVTFPMVMALGGMVGLLGVPLPGVEVGIAASAILLGLAVTSALRPPLAAAVALVGFFGIFHGHAHGTELPAGQSALLYSMGFVMATGCLHGVGIAVGLIHRWRWGQTRLRAAGANWKASSGDVWTVRIGLGAGKVVKLGRLPVKLQLSLEYMLVRPRNSGQEWNVQVQVTPVIPKLIKGILFE